jgi:bifunctional DNA-binding transcriptional regulator/antitoxin component of YhaV-PrlF toxin-antitoxin module
MCSTNYGVPTVSEADRLRSELAGATDRSSGLRLPRRLPERALQRDYSVYRTKISDRGVAALPAQIRHAWGVGPGDYVRWIDLGYAVVVLQDDDPSLGDRLQVALSPGLNALDEQRRQIEERRRGEAEQRGSDCGTQTAD